MRRFERVTGPRLDWDKRAACRIAKPGLFFAPDFTETRKQRLAREAEAKRVCAACRVQDACLAYALDAKEQYGIWGGLTEEERRASRRRMESA